MVTRQPTHPTTVLISGAGIGGLMAALEFWRQGFSVRILERYSRCSSAGDSFSIGPTATNAFRHWPKMAQRCAEIAYDPLIAYHSIDGERIHGPFSLEALFKPKEGEEDRLSGMHRYARPHFHRMLLDQLEEIAVPVEYSSEVADYGEDAEAGKGYVTLRSGERIEADLVIAADGVKGKSWPLVVGKPVPAKSTGEAIFRVAYDVNIALQDPVVKERFSLTENAESVIEVWYGPGMNAMFWRNEDDMTFAITHPDEGGAEESWSQHISPSKLLEYTATLPDWPEVADRLIKLIPEGQLMDFKLMWREPQPISVSPAGHVVQIGDAAHTFLPSSGNGGTQAIEDAVTLATCMVLALQEGSPTSDGISAQQNGDFGKATSKASKIAEAARVHNLLRFERVSCLQAFGVSNREKNRSNAKNESDTKKNGVTIPRWVVNHDPEIYARERFVEARNHLLHGTGFKNTNVPPGMDYVPWTIDDLLAARDRGEKTVLSGDWD